MSTTDEAIERWTKPENNTLNHAYKALAIAEANLSTIKHNGRPVMDEIERTQREFDAMKVKLDGMKEKVASAVKIVDVRRQALEAAIIRNQGGVAQTPATATDSGVGDPFAATRAAWPSKTETI